MSDPVKFCQQILKFEPWDRQAEILRAVRDNPRVAVRSGHKIGKSASAASLALWWFYTRPNGMVVLTAATDQQVHDIMWAELTRMHRRNASRIGGEIFDSHRTGLKHPDGRRILGFGTNKPENIAGYSGAELLFIIDEASGVDDEIFEAIEGNRAGGAQVVMFGNPTKQFGKFYDAFHSQKEFWKCIHVSSEETPNVKAGRVVVPGLATRDWLDEKIKELGEKSPTFLIRVKGEFPDRSDDAVIGVDGVKSLFSNWRMPSPADGRLELGVDVARFGDDDTVIIARRGNYAYTPVVISGADIPSVVSATISVASRHRVDHERPLIKVDGCGVGGGVVDYLHQAGNLDVIDVNSGAGAPGHEYARLRDQLWFNLRDWINAGGHSPYDKLMEQELQSITYKFDVRNQFKVESKDEMRKKLRPRRSPDRADALALSVWRGAATPASSEYDAPPDIDYAEDEFTIYMRNRLREIQNG